MTIYLDIEPDCQVGGHSIVVAFSGDVSTSLTWTLYRQDDFGREIVRGARNISVDDTSIGSVIDYEAPVDQAVTYSVVLSGGNGEESLTVPALSSVCAQNQYLRDLLDPEVHYITDFCLGRIEQTESTVRSGVFPTLGRAAPIVVVDTRETETGTLRFVASTQSQLDGLKRIFSRGTPMLMQIDSDYNLGRNGVLYFQPNKYVDKWLTPNGKLPYHTIEVSYTTIDAPSYAAVFVRTGIPFDLAVAAAPGTEITTGPLAGKTFCQGGLLQRYPTFDDLFNSGMTFAEAYFSTDACAGTGGGSGGGTGGGTTPNTFTSTFEANY